MGDILQEMHKPLSDEYVAGLFDGEGCVSCQRQWIQGKYEKYPRVQIQISIANNNLEIIHLLQRWFGGGKYRKHKNSKCFTWRVLGKQNLLKFLNAVYPHTVIKRGEVYHAIRFAETLREENLGSTPLTTEEHEIRMEVYEALKKRKWKHPYEKE